MCDCDGGCRRSSTRAVMARGCYSTITPTPPRAPGWPSGRRMRGDWRLCLAIGAAVALTACHTAFGPAPIDENWHTDEGARVTFFVRPGSFAEQNVARLR